MQHPKFQSKSMVRAAPKQNKYYNVQLLFWSDVRSHCKMIGFAMGAAQQDPAQIQSLRTLLSAAKDNCSDLSSALTKRVDDLDFPLEVDMPLFKPSLSWPTIVLTIYWRICVGKLGLNGKNL